MIDITAIPTRALTCPFPLVAVDTATLHYGLAPQLSLLLLVGRERACVASLLNHRVSLYRFLPQFHRTLTAGACRAMDSNDGHVFVLADATSALTLHRTPQLHHGVGPADCCSSTVFVGDSWDAFPRINKVLPVWGCNEVDLVCARQGERGVVWAITFEREAAHMIRVNDAVEQFFLQQQQQQQHGTASSTTSGCFVGATIDGVSLISPATGKTLLHFQLPSGTQHVSAVQAGFSGNTHYGVVSTCGTALMYDQRRADQPFWSKSLCESHYAKNTNDNDGMLMAYCGEGVWLVRASENLHCLRCTDGSVVCRSFPVPNSLHSSQLATSGLYFTDSVLHFVGSKRV